MWGSHNNAKLVELFRTPHNKVDPNKLDIDAANTGILLHFIEPKPALGTF